MEGPSSQWIGWAAAGTVVGGAILKFFKWLFSTVSREELEKAMHRIEYGNNAKHAQNIGNFRKILERMNAIENEIASIKGRMRERWGASKMENIQISKENHD